MTEIQFSEVFLACIVDNLDNAHPNSKELPSLFLGKERTEESQHRKVNVFKYQ